MILLKGMFGAEEAGTVVANPLYTIKKKIMVCRVVGDRGQLMVRQNALKIRSWVDVFGL